MENYVFVSNVLPVEEWFCKPFSVKADNKKSSSTFSNTVLAARELIFSVPDILAYPNAAFGQVMIVATKTAFQNEKLINRLQKLELEEVGDSFQQDHCTLVQALKYTITAKLSPLWNSVGKWLLSGKMFLHSQDPIMAVELEVNISNNQVEIVTQPQYLKSNLLTPSQLDLCKEDVLQFMDGGLEQALYEQQFGYQRVKVLPNLTSATLVSITKTIPPNSCFAGWSEMRRYWKNMYGYRLVEDENTQPMVYYNVRFFRNAQVLTYPEWTVRFEDPIVMRRMELKPCVVNFVQSTMHKIKNICGSSFQLSPKIQRAENQICTANSVQLPASTPANLSQPRRQEVTGLTPGFKRPSEPVKHVQPLNQTRDHVINPWQVQQQSQPSRPTAPEDCDQQPPKKIKPCFTVKSNLNKPPNSISDKSKASAVKPSFVKPNFKPQFGRKTQIPEVVKVQSSSQIQASNPAPQRPPLQVPLISSDLKGPGSFVSKIQGFSKHLTNESTTSPSTTTTPTPSQATTSSLTSSSNKPVFCNKTLEKTVVNSGDLAKNKLIAETQAIGGDDTTVGGIKAVGSGTAVGGSTSLGSGTAVGGSTVVGSGTAVGGSIVVGSGTAVGGSTSLGSGTAAIEKKKRTGPNLQNIDVETVIRSEGKVGLVKVNAATLLHFLKQKGVKQAKSKLKKEDLVQIAVNFVGVGVASPAPPLVTAEE